VAAPCGWTVELTRRWPRRADVLVVVPALNSRLRHWLSDLDAAVALPVTHLVSSEGLVEERLAA
jgi:hypothetical protein